MALFYIVLFVVIGIFFAAMLIYGTREKSFEQAIEEQRNKNNFDLLIGSSKSETAGKKESKKSKKAKDSVAKKSKESNKSASSAPVAVKSVAPKEPQQQQPNVTKVNNTATPKNVETVPAPKPAAAVVAQQSDVVDRASTTASSVKAPTAQPAKEVPKKSESKASKQQSQQSKQQPQTQHQPQPVVVPEVVVTEKKVVPSTADVKALVEQQPQPKVNNNNKKSKRSTSKASPNELSFEDILELVNSSYFSADDITRLTDALLNRQADEQNTDYNWHKKNDPVEALQKQLAEKKELIDQQMKNMEAAKKKSENLLIDFQILKRQVIKLNNDKDQLNKEIDVQKNNYASMLHEVEAKAQQKYEQRFNDIRVEERNRMVYEMNQLREEVSKLNDIITNQSDGMKDKENTVEKLSNLTQQLEDKNKELSKQAVEKDELYQQVAQKLNFVEETRQKETQQLESQIAELTKEKTLLEQKVQENVAASSSDIESYNLQVKNLQAELSESTGKRDQLDKAIADLKAQNSSISQEKVNIAKEMDSLKSKLGLVESDKKSLLSQLDSLTSEKNNLTSKSDDLNNLIKSNDEKLETLSIVLSKLGLSIEAGNLQSSIDDLKNKASQYDELNSKYNNVNELYELVSNEKTTLKSQLDSTKQSLKEEEKRSQEYASTLVDTEKILSELEEKSKNGESQKIAELTSDLAEKADENENLMDELSKSRENADNVNKLNESLNVQLRELKELVTNKEAQISGFKSKEEDLCENLEKIKEENKNLNSKIVKLNNLVQIGKHSFQEESEKVQNLESIVSLMNGKENSSNGSPAPTSNGNSS